MQNSKLLKRNNSLHILSKISCFSGGKRDIYDSNYGRVSKIMYNEVIRYNDQGTFYPMWGTCLGFQALCLIAAEKEKSQVPFLNEVKAKKKMMPVSFTEKALTSKLLKKASWNLIQAMSNQNVSIHNHRFGLIPEQFQKYKPLGETLDIIATGVGDAGIPFVSIVEGK